jgi:hypothetical protein
MTAASRFAPPGHLSSWANGNTIHDEQSRCLPIPLAWPQFAKGRLSTNGYVISQVVGMSFHPEFEHLAKIGRIILCVADASGDVTIAHSEQNICYSSQVAFTSIRIELAQCIKNIGAPWQSGLLANRDSVCADLNAPAFSVPRQNRQRCVSPSAKEGDSLVVQGKSRCCHDVFPTRVLDSRSSKIEATGANWPESKIIRLEGKGIIIHFSILLGDRDYKLVILHDHRHDVS